MKLSLKTAEIIFFIIACILGVLSHFFYKWSGNNSIVALFSPVNESTWEHLKLIFYPILLLSVIEYLFLKEVYPNYICVKFTSALLAMCLTIILFYTYTGVYGKSMDFINITIFFIAMAVGYLYSFYNLSTSKKPRLTPGLCILGISIMFFLFSIFTANPLEIGLFKVPD